MGIFRPHLRSLVIIVILAVLPLLVGWGAGIAASLAGCQINEGFATPCSFFGIDAGGLLYDLAMVGWLELMTLPLAVVLFGIWLLSLTIAVFRQRTRRVQG